MTRWGALVAALLVAACGGVAPSTSPFPVPRPVAPPPPSTAATVPRASAASQDTAAFYRRVEGRLLSRGLLRRDGGGADAAFTTDDVVRNFERVALFKEFVRKDGRDVAEQAPSRLGRWEDPVRVQVHFGPSVPLDQRSADLALLRDYTARLTRLTGHPITLVAQNGNFHVFVASVDEQATLAPALLRAAPQLSRTTAREIASLERGTYCVVYLLSAPTGGEAFTSAVALVRAEHPDLMRLACYQEEIAQGLGLINDGPDVRPSIFNDDEEFALLTDHDEILLRILYDPQLRVGMTAEEALPVVRAISEDIVGPDTGPT